MLKKVINSFNQTFISPFILISKLFSVKIQKQFCPSKVLGAFCPGITATKIWFFEMPKTKPVLVYMALYNSGDTTLNQMINSKGG